MELADLPALGALLLVTFIPTAIVVGLNWQFRRWISPEFLRKTNDVSGFLIAVVGVIYAVALGFVVVTVAVAFDSAQSNADAEAGDVSELIGVARLLPEPNSTRLRHDMARYAFEVRDVEFPMLDHDEQDASARTGLLDAVSAATATSGKGSSTQEILRETSIRGTALSYLHDLSVHRHHRLIDGSHHLPPILYAALGIGAITLLSFVFLFGVERTVMQLVMTGLVTASICVLLGVVYLLDRPFSGPYRVSPEAWTLVIENEGLAKYR